MLVVSLIYDKVSFFISLCVFYEVEDESLNRLVLASMDIHEHGVLVGKEKRRRIQCKHCGKQMSGWYRLRHHLSGVGGDATPCVQVTSSVREMFRTTTTGPKRGRTGDSEHVWCSYPNCLDFSSNGFREIMMTVSGRTIPDPHGSMFGEVLKEVEDHVEKVKDSWGVTGCSILLDAWVDHKGHDLVTFVADSPAGSVYLKSFDVSDIKHDSEALISIVDGLVDEVGVSNVVQIVACSASGWVGELGEAYVGTKKGVFWSVSVSHCFELMLMKIGEIDSLGEIVEAVNMITDYVNSNPLALKLVRDQDHSHGLLDMAVLSSEFEFFMPYLTVESIFRARDELAAMFASSSDWNKEEEDIAISNLVNDSRLWETVERVLKCSSPLIHGLIWLSSANNNQHVGHVYDNMDVIKESIAREFDNDELCYMPLWDVIDDVWNKLHSPLHAAGYFLNPDAFYSTGFHLDTEVAIGLISSLVHIVKELDVQVKVATQLDVYKVREGCFDEASDQVSELSPAEWWAEKASQHPELQSFAIKVLSQTCEGASRYMLKRRVAEKLLLTRGMSRCEKQHLEELAFVHYNLHLQSCRAKLSEEQ